MWNDIGVGFVYLVVCSFIDIGLVVIGGGDDVIYVWWVGDVEFYK